MTKRAPIHRPLSTVHPTCAVNWGRGRGGSKWRTIRKNVFIRDGWLCQPCKRKDKITPIDLSTGICGHIISVAAGGSDEMSNLETECRPCSEFQRISDLRREG